MKVEFEFISDESWMIRTDSILLNFGGISVETEISVTINVDLICIIVLLLFLM